jgi:hypothetical protein
MNSYKHLMSSPQESISIARKREFACLVFIYEQGMATADQIGQHVLGTQFNPQNKYHLTLVRRLRKRQLIAYFTSPATRRRVFYLTNYGADMLLNSWGDADHWIPHVDYHAPRAGSSIAHHLMVNDLRINSEHEGIDFISERIIRKVWGDDIPKIPDGLLGIPSHMRYWPDRIPVALEYENSARSKDRRFLMLYAGEKIIGKRVGGIVIVSKPATLRIWKQTFILGTQTPTISVLGKRGKKTIRLNTNLFRFWYTSTPESLHTELAKIRIAHFSEGQASNVWSLYSPWLGIRDILLDCARC